MAMKNGKRIGVLIAIAIVVFGITFTVIKLTENTDNGEMNYDTAVKAMEKINKKIKVRNLEPVKDNVDLEAADLKESLPDISKYPAQVENTTTNYIEIFSSTEKATTGQGTSDHDRWLVDVADSFNKAGFIVNGQPVSVRIRGIASGMGMDYISSGKYIPDVFSPSNEFWGDCLEEMGVPINLVEKRLAGNVAGIVLSKSKHKEVVNQYGAVNIKNVIQAIADNKLAMGYTNPLVSSTGANFLLSTLYSFDSENPLGDAAVSEFEKFQSNIPFVAYTTLQMKGSAQSGLLDGFVFEYQQYMNSPDVKANYDFTPFGIRHDNPVYELGDLSSDKKEILRFFIDYCKSDENQKLATSYGFNGCDDYKPELEGVSGKLLSSAQKIWKEKKNANKDVIAIFVADVSGSMDGESLAALKESLLSGSKFIGNDCYVGLVTYSNDVNVALPIGKFDLNQRSLFSGAVKNMSAGGNTATFNAVMVAEKMIHDVAVDHPNGKYMIFVLSDGETNRGYSLKETSGIIQALQVPIYTIGYNANIEALQEISKIGEAASINADTDDVVYKIQNLFNAQM